MRVLQKHVGLGESMDLFCGELNFRQKRWLTLSPKSGGFKDIPGRDLNCQKSSEMRMETIQFETRNFTNHSKFTPQITRSGDNSMFAHAKIKVYSNFTVKNCHQ